MTQYTIKPLVWVDNGCQIGDYYFHVTENTTGFYYLTVHDDDGEHDYPFDTLEQAKIRAQEIWNDYLKKYLEEVK